VAARVASGDQEARLAAAVAGTAAVTSTGVTLVALPGGAAATAAVVGGTTVTAGATMTGAVVTMSKAAAALIIADLIAGGMKEAEAAEAVQPLIDKPVSLVVDVTDHGGIDAYKVGQAKSVNGVTYRAVIAIQSPE
jgi:hypothetical protein